MARVSRETHLDRTRRATPRHGDVIYSREGSYHGIAAEIPDGVEACMGQRMVLIRPNVKALDFRFLRYWLNSNFVRSFIAGAKEGSGAPRINLPTIRRMAVPLPSLREQRAVGALLGALDDKIAVNERIAATAEDLMLTIASTVRWDRRIQLGEICSLRKEQCSPQELGVDIVDHYSLPAFDAKKVADRVSPASIKSNKFVIPGDAVLLSKLNPEIPRVWDAQPDQKILALASTEFLVLTPKSGLSTHQLWAVVAQQDFRSVLASRVTGTSKSHQRVRPAEALATEVVDPRQFGEEGQQIEGLAEKTALARKENRTLAALRDTLLPQLMSGRLRIRDTEKIVEDHA
ncbi:restriction endonuclease subunit S [Streptomyces albidoflavus]|uniref:Restriction endonuclease subunit S n=1 Tax=Streptomyces sp. NBC_00008 TaxID=2903610 RepID=A0AAU2W2I3_9ACTN